jgi:hypothetical protein
MAVPFKLRQPVHWDRFDSSSRSRLLSVDSGLPPLGRWTRWPQPDLKGNVRHGRHEIPVLSDRSERKQDFNEAIRTYELMVEVYREIGYETVELPRVATDRRAKFILQNLDGSRAS